MDFFEIELVRLGHSSNSDRARVALRKAISVGAWSRSLKYFEILPRECIVFRKPWLSFDLDLYLCTSDF